MQNLKVSLVQTSLFWEDAKANLQLFDAKLAESASQSDLVLLPEMFNTGFTMNTPKCAETMDGETVNWMMAKSIQYGSAIGGSVIIREDNSVFNRFILTTPNGKIQQYNKRHLFRMGDEQLHFSAGKQHSIFELNGWKLCPQVCYDLRFPVWSRNTSEYDALIYVANWPEIRSVHWEKLLQARAIENQCYVLAVNRVGLDGHDTKHNGCSGVIDYMGEWQSHNRNDEVILKGELSMSDLETWRKKFPVSRDADTFTIN